MDSVFAVIQFSRQKTHVGLCYLLALTILTGCNRTAFQVLTSSNALGKAPGNVWVKVIREKPHAQQVLVVNGQGHRRYLPADSVWGYRTDHGSAYRLYAHDTYEVVEQGPLMIYRNEEWVGDTRWENYYFSLAPDSTIYDVDKRTCQRVFAQDRCMLTLLDQMRNSHLLRTDAHGSYGLANAYRYCHGGQRQAKH